MSPRSLDIVWGVKKMSEPRSLDRVPAGPNQIRKLGNPCQDTSDAELRPGAKAKVYATFTKAFPLARFRRSKHRIHHSLRLHGIFQKSVRSVSFRRANSKNLPPDG